MFFRAKYVSSQVIPERNATQQETTTRRACERDSKQTKRDRVERERAMADFTFLFNRKGAIYPLDVQTSRGQRLFNSATGNEWPFNNLLDSTLVHLCCKVLVNMSDSQLAAVADVVPAELFLSLFKASLFPVRDGAIDVRVPCLFIYIILCFTIRPLYRWFLFIYLHV